MYRLHMTTRRRRETLRAFFGDPIRVGVVLARSRGLGVGARVCARVGVLGGGGVGAGSGSLGGVDEGVEAGGAARGLAVVAVELEAVEALQMAPVVAHGEREARALHGARAPAAAAGLARAHCRCHLGLRSPDYGADTSLYVYRKTVRLILNRCIKSE